jgi:hypothetical protein
MMVDHLAQKLHIMVNDLKDEFRRVVQFLELLKDLIHR